MSAHAGRKELRPTAPPVEFETGNGAPARISNRPVAKARQDFPPDHEERDKRRKRIAVLCRREGIAQSLYYSWSKEFLGEA